MKLDDLRQLFREPELFAAAPKKATFYGVDMAFGPEIIAEVLRCPSCDLAISFPMSKGIRISNCPNCGARVRRSVEREK